MSQGPDIGAAYEYGGETARRRLSRHLVGAGVELGPGHMPFPIVMPSTSVTYLDAWSPDDSGERFPELEDFDFAPPDTICDFNVEGLAPLSDGSQDFVIASHVLEHLANPLRMLCELHRVVRPGGTVVICLPDRHNTFDRGRPPTPLGHLVQEFEAGVTEVDDRHIEEFIKATTPFQEGGGRAPDPDLDLASMSIRERSLALLWCSWEEVTVPEHRREMIELHRKRSIHAHVWDADEFVQVLCYGVLHLGHGWELVDGLLPGDPGGRPEEFALVVRRAPVPGKPEVMADALNTAWKTWRSYWEAVRSELGQLRAALAASQEEAAALRVEAEEQRRSAEESQRAALEAIGVIHRLGQGRDLAPEEIRTVTRQPGGEAVPELIHLLLRYRNRPGRTAVRSALGRVKRLIIHRGAPPT